MRKKKFEIQYKTVQFIAKAISYYYASPKTEYEKVFMDKHISNYQKLIKKFPYEFHNPIKYYEYACNLYSKYTNEEKMYIWNEDSQLSKDKTALLWRLLERCYYMPIGIYYFEVFVERLQMIWFKIIKKRR